MNDARHPRRIILCADDYALHPHVDQAVLRLASARRLSATTCMTTSPRWPEAATALRPLRPALAAGLHFNLTESHGGAHRARALGTVILAAYARRISVASAREQWRRQLDAFERALGTPPDFIDGHQHVHQLPRVRDALLAELQSRYQAGEMPWVRSTIPAGRLARDRKAAVIALLGARTATRRWRRAGLACNRGFAGVYGFDAPDATAYGVLMRRWLQELPDRGLLMCHPAVGAIAQDPIGRQRPVEFSYLMSGAFAAQLQDSGCAVQPGPLQLQGAHDPPTAA